MGLYRHAPIREHVKKIAFLADAFAKKIKFFNLEFSETKEYAKLPWNPNHNPDKNVFVCLLPNMPACGLLPAGGGILKEEKTLRVEGIGFKFETTPDFN